MSVATPVARSAVRSMSTISRAEPRSISANAHACPTAPTPTTATLFSMVTMFTASGGCRRAGRRPGSYDPPIGVVLGSVEPEFEIELCFGVMPTPVGVEAQFEGEGSDRAKVHLELAASPTEVLVLLDHANRSPGVVRQGRMSHPFPSCNAVVRNAAMCKEPYGRRAAGSIGDGDQPGAAPEQTRCRRPVGDSRAA